MNQTSLRATGALSLMSAVIFAGIGGAFTVAAIACGLTCIAATISYCLAGRTSYSSKKFSDYR